MSRGIFAHVLRAFLILFCGAIGLHAQTVFTWTGQGMDNSWFNGANWDSTPPPDSSANANVFFGDSPKNDVRLYDNDHWSGVAVYGLNVAGNTRPYYFDAEGDGYLTMTIGAGGITYNPAQPVRSVIAADFEFIANQTWHIASGALVFAGSINGGDGGFTFTKTGAGSLILENAENYNLYNTTLNLNDGRLVLTPTYSAYYGPLGTADLVIGPASVSTNPILATSDSNYDYSVTLANHITLNGVLTTENKSELHLTGLVTLNSDTTISSKGRALFIENNIAEATAGKKLTVNSGGVVVLSGTNGYTGGTNVAKGALIFGNVSSVPATGALSTASTGYIGRMFDPTGATLPLATYLGRFDKANTHGTIGFDTDPSLGDTSAAFSNFTEAIDLSAVPTGTPFASDARLGSATQAIISGTITPQGANYQFGGGNGLLIVSSQLTGSGAVVADSPIETPLTVGLGSLQWNVGTSTFDPVAHPGNSFTGGVSARNSAVLFGPGAMPAAGDFTLLSGGYIGNADSGVTAANFLLRFPTSTDLGMIGFDYFGDGTATISDPIDLSRFTGGSVYLGSATHAILGPTAIITPQGSTYRFGAYKGGSLEVASTLSGARSVIIGDPTSPATFGNYSEEEYSTVKLSGDNTYTGGTNFYGGRLMVGHNNALGTGALTVNAFPFPTAISDQFLGESPAPRLEASTGGLVIPNNITLNAELNAGGQNNFTLAGNISGTGELYVGEDSVGGFTLGLTGNNTFDGGVYVASGAIINAGSNTALGTGPVGFGYSGGTINFQTAAPVIGSLMTKEENDYAYLTAAAPNTLLTINQTEDGKFRGEFGSTDLSDAVRVIKNGSNTLRLDYGGLYYHNGVLESGLGGSNPQVSLQVNLGGALILGSNFYTGELSATTAWIHGGTLMLDGATLGANVVIDNSGQLTGSGTVSGAVSLTSNHSFGQADMPSKLRLNGGLNATTAGTTVTVAGGALWLAGATGPNIGTIAVNTNAAVVFDGADSLPATGITAASGSYVGMGAGFLSANVGNGLAALSPKLTPAAFAGTLGIDNYYYDTGTYTNTYRNTGDINLSGFTHANFAGLGSINDGLIESSAVITAPANGNLQLSGIDGGYLQVEAPLLTANGVTQVTIGRTDGHGDGVVSLNNIGNTYTGGTDVISGTLMINEASNGSPGSFTATPFGSGALTLHGGAQIQTPDLDLDFTIANAINLPGGGTKPARINLWGDYLYLTGSISGSGALEVRNRSYGDLTLSGNNSGWSGGLIVSDNATVYVDSPTALGTGILSFGTTPLDSSPAVIFNTPTATIYGLSGGFHDNYDGYYASLINLGTTALTINQSSNSEFKGSITGSVNVELGSGRITKTGPGTLVLSGRNDYPGPTTISAGTLQFAQRDSLYYDHTMTVDDLAVEAGATIALNVGGDGEFSASDIDQLKALGSATSGFLSGSYLGLDTTHAAAGNFTYSGVITNPNSGANILGLTKLGAGTLTLTGANTYTGPTTISAGTLSVGLDNALPTATTVSLDIGSTLDVANNQAVAGLNSITPSSIVSIATGKNFTVAGTGNSDYAGNISGLGTLGKDGTGIFYLRGTATHTGGTTINAGTLSIGNGGNTGSLTGNVSVTTPGNLAFNRFDAVTFAGIVSGTGSLTKAGSGTLTLTGANTYSGGTTVANGTLVGNTTSLQGAIANNANLSFDQASAGTYAGIISGAGNLTKLGAGNLTLGGNNTYTGSTTVSGGTLTLGVANALPVTTQLLLTNGSVLAVNSNQTIAGFFGASDPASLLQLAGVTFTVAMPVANVSTTFAGSVTGTGTFAVSGAGNDIVNLTGNIASTIATQIGTGATLIIGTGGSLTGPITTNGTLSFDNPGIQTISGVISGTGGLLATAGLTTLSGANTYSGGTVINGGTLLVANLSGSGTGTGPVTVGSGGVFGGTGSISGPMTINAGGTVSPGASPGILTVGATTFAGGGHFKFEINDTTGTPGTQWDLLSISGALAINATPGAPFILDLASLTAANATGLLANFDNTKTYSWQFVTATGLITGFDPGAFQYNASLFQNSLGNLGGHFFVSQNGSTLSLNFTPVPEPSTYALLALGLGLLGLTAWRRRRA